MSEKKRKGKKAATVLILIFFVVYVPSAIHWFYGNAVSTDYIRYGTIEDYINTDAVIIRDSTVYKAPFSGIYIAEAEEGDKVPADFRIASVFNSSSTAYIDELKQKEEQIIRAKGEKLQNSELFSRDILILEDEIGEKLKLVAKASQKNSIAEVQKVKEEINRLVQKKAYILGDEGAADTYITSLENEMASIEAKIEMNRENITTPVPGIVSYILDDYEEILNSDSISEITPQLLDKVVKSGNNSHEEVWSVETGEPVAKLTQNLSYYFAVCLDTTDAYRFEPGDKIKIRVNENELECSAKVVHRSQEVDGRCIVAFEADKYLSELTASRCVNVDLIISSYTGKIVPISCLFDINNKDNKAKVILVKASFAGIREVNILGRNEFFAIIDDGESKGNNVELYDVYIENPKNIEDGQSIR
ncbi:MAG: HlyD family efflux transporter periplasmic adaptor subunit [Eubacteriales bacterium]|nr:HlyD family efflux transporter periplasmic adaptor subunit [Eubacteriales bacterium]